MNNFVKIQEYFAQGLLAEPDLAAINVLQYRKMRAQDEIDWSVVYLKPRWAADSGAPGAGRAGCGVVVEMPTFEVAHPSLMGPPAMLTVSALVLEEPNINFAPDTGTQMSAEEVAKVILDSTHQWWVEGTGIISAGFRAAIEPVDDFPGIVAYRVKLTLQALRSDKERVAVVTVNEVGGNVTLACATDGAAIYWTDDCSFPGPGNAAAHKYDAPFDVSSGITLMVAAYKDGMHRSNVKTFSAG